MDSTIIDSQKTTLVTLHEVTTAYKYDVLEFTGVGHYNFRTGCLGSGRQLP
ncbi:hypothetical protein O9993_06910 [Vibrio lentus]|nr:hypothetical protein [Vibrio lentus]